MQKPKTTFRLVPAISLWISLLLLDQGTKSAALGGVWQWDYGWLRLEAVQNYGIFGGFLANLHPWISRVFFSVIFGFLLAGLALFLYFWKHRSLNLLKWGAVVYIAGVQGNVLDRMFRGGVIDWIALVRGGHAQFAVNLADFAVITGFAMVAYALWRDRARIWRPEEQRKGHWVDQGFQGGFGAWFVAVGLTHFGLIAIYSFVFLKVYLDPFAIATGQSAEEVLREYVLGLLVLECGAAVLTFLCSVWFSHRIVGPLVAFERFLNERRAGVSGSELKLREGDQLRERLERLAKSISERL